MFGMVMMIMPCLMLPIWGFHHPKLLTLLFGSIWKRTWMIANWTSTPIAFSVLIPQILSQWIDCGIAVRTITNCDLTLQISLHCRRNIWNWVIPIPWNSLCRRKTVRWQWPGLYSKLVYPLWRLTMFLLIPQCGHVTPSLFCPLTFSSVSWSRRLQSRRHLLFGFEDNKRSMHKTAISINRPRWRI